MILQPLHPFRFRNSCRMPKYALLQKPTVQNSLHIFSPTQTLMHRLHICVLFTKKLYSQDVLLLLSELQEKYPHKQIWIELGLQTMHNDTLQKMNTHTTVEQFDSAIDALTRIHIPVIAHVILGFPNETKEMMLQTISHVSRLPVSGIKLQLLHVLKNTELGNRYLEKPFPVMELMPYCDLVIDCLELLPPDLVVHRLTGDGPRNLLLAPLWSTDKKRVLNTIHHRLKERDTWQGRLFIS